MEILNADAFDIIGNMQRRKNNANKWESTLFV